MNNHWVNFMDSAIRIQRAKLSLSETGKSCGVDWFSRVERECSVSEGKCDKEHYNLKDLHLLRDRINLI